MRFTDLLISAATVTAVAAIPASKATTGIKKRQSTFQFTGVSEAGGEFGEGNIPGVLGTDYTWPVHSTIDTLTAAGMNTFRIPMLMERIIPNTMTGAVEANYAAGLDDIVNYVTSKGAYAIIDPHNYGRYYGNVISSTSDFQAFWTTIAGRYKDNSLVIFDTNNEYHDMDNALVAQLNQAAIDGIRAAGATSQYIFVEGNSWSGAWSWVSSGTATDMVNLSDPQDKIIYEMHQYLDSDSSGTSATCVSTTIGQERITEATAWLQANGKKGVIGETAGGVNSDCISAVTSMLQYMEDNSDVWSGWLWWGGGPWWGDYMYSMEPPDGAAYTGFLPSITQFL